MVLGTFEEEKLRELLELPEAGVACLMPLGYPAEEPGAPKRKEVAELLTHQVKISPLLPNGGGGFLFLAWREYGPRNGCEKGNFPLTSPVLPVIIIELFHRQQGTHLRVNGLLNRPAEEMSYD